MEKPKTVCSGFFKRKNIERKKDAKKPKLNRLRITFGSTFPVAFVGVATWFRNGMATNPRPLGPSARRHQCGGRQMAFIDG